MICLLLLLLFATRPLLGLDEEAIALGLTKGFQGKVLISVENRFTSKGILHNRNVTVEDDGK